MCDPSRPSREPSYDPTLKLSLYTEYLLDNPVVACSRRQLHDWISVHRMNDHLQTWKTALSRETFEYHIISEEADHERSRVALQAQLQNALLREAADPPDVFILSLSLGLFRPRPIDPKPSDLFFARPGELTYAVRGDSLARLEAHAQPLEEPIDSLLLTLSEIDVIRVSIAPDARCQRPRLTSMPYWRELAHTNTKEFLPDSSFWTMLLIVLFLPLFLHFIRRS